MNITNKHIIKALVIKIQTELQQINCQPLGIKSKQAVIHYSRLLLVSR